MTATYVRVSTAQQNLARQLEGKEGEVYWDKISGMVPFEDRPDAGRLLDDAKKGNIEEIQVHSIKRLGRDTIDILQTIQAFTKLGVNITSKKEGFNTLLPDGRENPVAKIITSVLSSIAEIDYQNRREAQAEGIAVAKAQGKYKGRANWTSLSDGELLGKHADIVRQLPGHSIRQTARLTGKSKTTVLKVKKTMERLKTTG